MKKLFAIMLISVFALAIAGCAGGGKATAPGQIKKETGIHPVSGKVK